jgi:RNA polymerase sigma-70 factor (ECF subfamily)
MSPPPAADPTTSDPITDEDLVERCRIGDPEARRRLYEQHAPRVHRFISALGVRQDERDDVAQDVFMAVYSALDGFRGEAQLSTWIYKIAARQVGRLRFRRGLRQALGETIRRSAPDAIDPSDRALSLHMLDQMLGKLNVKKRTVLVLFEIEGLRVEQIARVIGCPPNTVWSRLHHARSEMLKMARRLE